MRIVTLVSQTKRGKQIIKQHGDRWEVVRREVSVIFTSAPGPWLLLLPLTEERAPAEDVRAARMESASRWVHEFSSEHFKVMP